ncbi:MAG: esterase-like activity of phytase family protein [Cypionkella sp.]|nr:esterase-like activity of phytase family protein [Cypionkella sp.]
MHRRFARALGAAIFAVMGLNPIAAQDAPQGFLTQFEWPSDDPLHGGLSGIEVSGDGQSVVLLSDQGAIATGQISRDTAGLITNITLSPFQLLKALGDAPLSDSRNDSEGLALDGQGRAYISFEGVARVLRYDDLAGSAQNMPDHPDFAGLQTNSALEALAVDADGTLYTLPERSGAEARPFPIYRLRAGVWDNKLSLPREAGFMPVGADFGPDGRLYILLRQFHGISGFSSKLIRMTVGEDALGPAEVVMQSRAGFHDNLEGVAIWQGAAGDLRATMVADDNFLPFLSTGLVEYRLPD